MLYQYRVFFPVIFIELSFLTLLSNRRLSLKFTNFDFFRKLDTPSKSSMCV